jgi:hypothetical protein
MLAAPDIRTRLLHPVPREPAFGAPVSESDDPVSPELALVDPDLAASARAQLPDIAQSPVREQDARRALELTPVAVTPRTAEPEALVADHRGKRARRPLPTIALLTIVIAAGIAGVILKQKLPKGQSGSEARVTDSRAQAATTAASDHRASQRPTRSTTAASGGTHAPRPAQGTAPSSTSRTFVWPVVKGASFYKVEFFRRRQEVFGASPAVPRLALPMHWVYRGRQYRLLEGAYRWKVRPAFGSRGRARYGAPITVSVWVFRSAR